MGDLTDLIAQVNAAFGADTLMTGSDERLRVKYHPTGVLPVDVLLRGGIPAGRFTEIFGDSSVLKSYIGLRCIAEVQKHGGTAALVDTEHAFDPDWAGSLGVSANELLLQHPPTGEAAVKVTEVLIRNQADLIVWDSVAATLPKAYQQAAPGEDEQPARLAALMSKACQRLNAANSKTAILCVNQTRVNVGKVFGPVRDSTPGGRALDYYASFRVRFSKAGKVSHPIKLYDGEKWVDGREVTGLKVRASLEKSKLSAPHREVMFIFDHNTGAVDDLGFLVAQGMEHGFVEVKSGRYTVPEAMEGNVHGQENFKTWLAENSEVVEWMRNRLLKAPSTESRGSRSVPRRKKGAGSR